MKLVKLTLIGDTNAPVYVNPNQVVSVTPFAKYTSILTTNSTEKETRINVKETAEFVVQELGG